MMRLLDWIMTNKPALVWYAPVFMVLCPNILQDNLFLAPGNDTMIQRIQEVRQSSPEKRQVWLKPIPLSSV